MELHFAGESVGACLVIASCHGLGVYFNLDEVCHLSEALRRYFVRLQ